MPLSEQFQNAAVGTVSKYHTVGTVPIISHYRNISKIPHGRLGTGTSIKVIEDKLVLRAETSLLVK